MPDYLTLIASAISLVGSSGQVPSSEAAPVRLVAEGVDGGVRLQVVGAADRNVETRYSLEVETGSKAGSNRSSQRGRARLQPGLSVTLITMTLGSVGEGSWTARLTVEGDGISPYEEVQSSDTCCS